LGQETGIFKKHDIVLENFATQGSGETLQAVVSNAAQVGVGVGTLGVLRAYQRGAPIKIFGASFTGVGDLYWYVRADSAIKSLADAGPGNTIAFSSSGSSVHNAFWLLSKSTTSRPRRLRPEDWRRPSHR
jgi:NitT/TauT family transport system substrate-binding protein